MHCIFHKMSMFYGFLYHGLRRIYDLFKLLLQDIYDLSNLHFTKGYENIRFLFMNLYGFTMGIYLDL